MFFNPSADMETPTESVNTRDVSSTLANTSLNDRSETMQSHRSTSASHPGQRRYPRSSVGVGPFLSRGRSTGAGSSSRILPETDRPGLSPSTSPMERPPVSTATGNTLSRQQSYRSYLRHQSTLRSPAAPTTPQASGSTTSTAMIQRRRNSHEDIEAERGILIHRFPLRFSSKLQHWRPLREILFRRKIWGNIWKFCGTMERWESRGRPYLPVVVDICVESTM
jgi:hypothetical protein